MKKDSGSMLPLNDGDEVRGRMIMIFAAVRNEELNEGRGKNVDNSYHRTRSDATIATHHIDVMGSDGTVEERLALELSDGRIFLLKGIGNPIRIDENPEMKAKLREEAIKKLSPAEMTALGLGEKN